MGSSAVGMGVRPWREPDSRDARAERSIHALHCAVAANQSHSVYELSPPSVTRIRWPMRSFG